MNEHGAGVEWYWQRRTEVHGEKPVTVCNLFHHKYHMHWRRIEPDLLRWQNGKTHTAWVTAEPENHERKDRPGQPRMQLRNELVASNVPITSLSACANSLVRCSVSNRLRRFTHGTVPDHFHSRRITDKRSECLRKMKTNFMHCLSSVYFVNQPLHVSGIYVARHQEVYYIYIYTAIGTCCAF